MQNETRIHDFQCKIRKMCCFTNKRSKVLPFSHDSRFSVVKNHVLIKVLYMDTANETVQIQQLWLTNENISKEKLLSYWHIFYRAPSASCEVVLDIDTTAGRLCRTHCYN